VQKDSFISIRITKKTISLHYQYTEVASAIQNYHIILRNQKNLEQKFIKNAPV